MNIDPQYLSQIRYRCIGPTRGGRVVAVAADPDKQNIFYFGAVAGGIWRSDDAGLYWENISDGQLNTGSIGALVHLWFCSCLLGNTSVEGRGCSLRECRAHGVLCDGHCRLAAASTASLGISEGSLIRRKPQSRGSLNPEEALA